MDQAETLRQLMGRKREENLRPGAIAFVSLQPADGCSFLVQVLSPFLGQPSGEKRAVDLGVTWSRADIFENARQLSLVLVLGGQTPLVSAPSLFRLLSGISDLRRFGVIVNQVTDGREGLDVFEKFKNLAPRSLSVAVEYLGHCVADSRLRESVINQKFLLDLKAGTPVSRSLLLIAKQLRERWFDGEEWSGEGVPASNRFREEPRRQSPRITAGIWRTLLGEVKR